jgi:hypothetical protein
VAIAVASTAVMPVAGAAEPVPVQTPKAGATEPAEAPAAAEPPPSPASPSLADFEQRIAEGDRLVAEGKPAEGAEQLSSAYSLMPAELRVGDVGRFVIVSASNAYESAWQATADVAHLEANQVLLKAYLADLDDARAKGQATSAADEHEQALRDRSVAIEQMVAQARPAEPVTAPRIDPTIDEPQLELTFPPPDPRLRRNARILVGVGAAGTVAGGIMVIVGAVTASRAEEVRREMPAEEAGDARSSKTAGTIVATTGALLFSGSVMMLGVGTNRLSDLRREMALTLRPTIGGMVLRGRF